ncbi:alpha/beta fold hydrolase [Luteolibacter sp. GHJ8]|uniref:Alpha/beta fold hydrolase n=1 Tax=Luteolibacter rhizosphaerae TaxID=2989719 RepID=A0ABT3G590_9BACT|nr:alpha/beta fold hydrolase [Luteolibacter rhizosphaerae]MCW1915010.1 alpha/beta fold hydrolase [Luteolibacter rhizosphaerae]
MPLLESAYRAPAYLPGGHLQTIHPALFRRMPFITTRRERLELPDGDFLDLDWSTQGRERLAILSHGLEADSKAPYIQGMATALQRRGWDVLAWNYRGCSGELNRLLPFYHSGASHDLHEVVLHALRVHPAARIDLVGFSLGGNMTLKYLGERAPVSPRLHRAVAFSVPCDLACSSRRLSTRTNRVYMDRFLRSLRRKLAEKQPHFPGEIDLTGIGGVRNFRQFDDRFTAPLHGFRDAADYWARASSRPFMPRITIPALLVNAANDPFLGPGCFPREEAEASRTFHLEIPADGGHCGFSGGPDEYWSERRAAEFLST